MTTPSAKSPLAPFARRAMPALLLLAACHRTDFTEAAVPAAATSLTLVSTQRADTATVDVTLGGAAPSSLGSFTGEVEQSGAWRFLSCDAQQSQALLACKEHGNTVRVAAAWAGGAHAGALVRVTYVRTSPAAQPQWTFTVSEAHGARGTRLLDSLDVKRLNVEARR